MRSSSRGRNAPSSLRPTHLWPGSGDVHFWSNALVWMMSTKGYKMWLHLFSEPQQRAQTVTSLRTMTRKNKNPDCQERHGNFHPRIAMETDTGNCGCHGWALSEFSVHFLKFKPKYRDCDLVHVPLICNHTFPFQKKFFSILDWY